MPVKLSCTQFITLIYYSLVLTTSTCIPVCVCVCAHDYSTHKWKRIRVSLLTWGEARLL